MLWKWYTFSLIVFHFFSSNRAQAWRLSRCRPVKAEGFAHAYVSGHRFADFFAQGKRVWSSRKNRYDVVCCCSRHLESAKIHVYTICMRTFGDKREYIKYINKTHIKMYARKILVASTPRDRRDMCKWERTMAGEKKPSVRTIETEYL